MYVIKNIIYSTFYSLNNFIDIIMNILRKNICTFSMYIYIIWKFYITWIYTVLNNTSPTHEILLINNMHNIKFTRVFRM
jgi:hypothetical protein